MSIARHYKILPQWVAPLKLASQGVSLSGTVPLQSMPRLSESLASDGAAAEAALQFLRDESGYRVVIGEISFEADLTCQRCMQALRHSLVADVAWILTGDIEQAKGLPKRYEPWILAESESDSDLYGIIEEELLLALPIVAFHDIESCGAQQHYSTGEHEPVKKAGPFDVLHQLKLKK